MLRKDCKNIIFIISILAIIAISPFIFTMKAPNARLDFSKTGEIGSTIGGITAPIVGTISILLLFYTFNEQRKFNKKQVEFNRKQIAISSDEQFKSALFILLQTQRDILSKVSGKIEILDYQTKKPTTLTLVGTSFLKEAIKDLKALFYSFENEKYYGQYNSQSVNDYENYLQKKASTDIPEDIAEKENKKIFEYANNILRGIYINKKYNINEEEFNKYKKEGIKDQLKHVSSIFFYKNNTIDYYFRHLYYILKFIKQAEDKEINELSKGSKIETVKNKYKLYAESIQAQMSTDELFIIFYNCILLPETLKLILHYNLLVNLTIENLVCEKHNYEPKFKLKSKVVRPR